MKNILVFDGSKFIGEFDQMPEDLMQQNQGSYYAYRRSDDSWLTWSIVMCYSFDPPIECRTALLLLT